MVFRTISTVALVVLVAFGSVRVAAAQESKEAGGDAKKTDLDNMQGTWSIVAAEREGKATLVDSIKTMQFIIKGDSFTLTIGEREEKGTLKLNASVKPKSMDLILGDEHEKAAHGIYELTTGTLKMCWTQDGGERPKEFATKPDSNMTMFTLKRETK